MNTEVSPIDLERFRDLIVHRLGLQFDDAKLGFLGEVLRGRLAAALLPASAYLAQLDVGTSSNEVAMLAQELTVPETYFFRHAEQYRAFAEIALPDRLRAARTGGTRVNIVSAGCASGEEPYSLAMIVRETSADAAPTVSILGVDVNPAQIERAQRARFSAWVLRETPPDVKTRWFRADGREFVLDPAIRASVKFDVCNLVDDRALLWHPESHDIIFCRNVLMYFERAIAEAVVGRMARSLRPGGYLFLGHAETLRGLSNSFHLRHTHGTFYYQRRERLSAGAPKPHAVQRHDGTGLQAAVAARTVDDSLPSELVVGSDSWIDAIQQASDRIRKLAASPSGAAAGDKGRSAPLKPVREIGVALELLRQERFAEALDVVIAFPPESHHDAEVLLLRAVLLTHSGQLELAERACEQLLTINELNAEAHYLLALCREGVNDRLASVYHDQVAVYLDPSFAMAHLHLGLLARRARDRATARRELGQALVLLQREDASRVLLFGGGFRREALIELCRRELRTSGGPI